MPHRLAHVVGPWIVVVAIAFLWSAPVQAQMLVEAVLCEQVVEREPQRPLVSDGDLAPTISAAAGNVYLWTKIATDGPVTLVHTWYKQHDTGTVPESLEIASVPLSIQPSTGFRTWSSVTLVPGVSVGSWRVTVTTESNPGEILYQAAFNVK